MNKILETLKQKWAEFLLEILVIVIGILGAYTLNNWNEHRKDKVVEIKALHDLLQEFKANQISFDSHLAYKKEKREGIILYLDMEKTDPNYAKRLPHSGRGTFNLTLGMVKSIMNSDKIDKLENDSIRYLLSNWMDLLGNFHEDQENQNRVLFDHYRPYVNARKPNPTQFKNYKTTELEQFNITLRNDMEFINILGENQNELRVQVRNGEEIQATINQIISLLEKEIN